MSSNLGVGGELHDSNIAILNNQGDIELAINEERLSRTKKEGRFPYSALALVPNTNSKIIIAANSLDESIRQLSSEHHNIDAYAPFLNRLKFYEEELDDIVCHVGHHESHAASAYYTSGFNEATIVTMDGGSFFEPWCTTLYKGKGSKLELIDRNPRCFTDFYFFTTALLGFKPNMHEGKITGLAAYGEVNEKILDFFEKHRTRGESLAAKIVTWKDISGKKLKFEIRA